MGASGLELWAVSWSGGGGILAPPPPIPLLLFLVVSLTKNIYIFLKKKPNPHLYRYVSSFAQASRWEKVWQSMTQLLLLLSLF